ncbi:hypothetical protein CU254_23015 [Amycolatopsis sp. AA4]|uniref:hypothetical protein n=1 Tax=Actinomycetes TaxID=1760 RepID=UPI0001B545A1|nr:MULTISPECIES: hypothetical protein [Actinomycetes]ATY12993.1 hypothetical protein CU254_23015 [Amycolatopsis sp. AA4]EFL08856.1 predicted protein [Streptomyces sp. AA4]
MSWLLALSAALVVGIVVGSSNVIGPGACGPGAGQAISKGSGSPHVPAPAAIVFDQPWPLFAR